jgi:Protein of unknown function (DUF815)
LLISSDLSGHAHLPRGQHNSEELRDLGRGVEEEAVALLFAPCDGTRLETRGVGIAVGIDRLCAALPACSRARRAGSSGCSRRAKPKTTIRSHATSRLLAALVAASLASPMHHALDQDPYLDIVRSYAARLKLSAAGEALDRAALQWSMARSARSGRVAWQFILDRAGREDVEVRF